MGRTWAAVSTRALLVSGKLAGALALGGSFKFQLWRKPRALAKAAAIAAFLSGTTTGAGAVACALAGSVSVLCARAWCTA